MEGVEGTTGKAKRIEKGRRKKKGKSKSIGWFPIPGQGLGKTSSEGWEAQGKTPGKNTQQEESRNKTREKKKQSKGPGGTKRTSWDKGKQKGFCVGGRGGGSTSLKIPIQNRRPAPFMTPKKKTTGGNPGSPGGVQKKQIM